jgi:hypothetical protein
VKIGSHKQDGGQPSTGPLADLIHTWSKLTISQLRKAWQERWHTPAPPVQSADLLARLMAWRLQSDTFGGLDRETRRRLDDLGHRLAVGKSLLPSTGEVLPIGTVLTRDWRGTQHRVIAVESGFAHEGKTYATLSEVARAITGTHWSGPRFFGLEEKPRRSAKTGCDANPAIAGVVS